MPGRPSRPALQERYDRRRKVIVATAASIFARHGYDRTRMQDLAAQMDLATGALYHYFGSKEQLLMAICDDGIETILAQAREVSLGDDPAIDRLRTLVRLWVAHMIEYREHVLVFQQERHIVEADEHWARIRDSLKAFDLIVSHAVEEAGIVAPGSNPRVVVGALRGMVNYTINWCRPGGDLSAAEIAEGYLTLLLGAP